MRIFRRSGPLLLSLSALFLLSSAACLAAPTDESKLMDIAAGDIQAERWRVAIPTLNKIIAHHPNPKAFYLRGRAYLELANYFEANVDLSTAIDLDPNYEDALVCRGHLLQLMHKDAESVADFTKAIKLKPTADAYRGRAKCNRRLHHYDESVSDYYAAIKLLGPNVDEPTRNQLAKSLRVRAKAYDNEGKHDLADTDRKTLDQLSETFPIRTPAKKQSSL